MRSSAVSVSDAFVFLADRNFFSQYSLPDLAAWNHCFPKSKKKESEILRDRIGFHQSVYHVYTNDQAIYVENAEGLSIDMFDITGRHLKHVDKAAVQEIFYNLETRIAGNITWMSNLLNIF